MSDINRALSLHEEWRGKIEIRPRVAVDSMEALALAYTPGVAEPCKEIARDRNLVNRYTRKWNTVAVITDGTAVLGLGDIGPEAGLPVMEGKALLFKAFADVDAVPILLNTKDVDEMEAVICAIAPTFGGINLEDISAPRCFELERRLKNRLEIPVFHDDQHGTAAVVLAALQNALLLTGRDIGTAKIVINGAGAAGIACARLLMAVGARHLILCDRQGMLSPSTEGMNPAQAEIAALTNPNGGTGTLSEALTNADVFIGVSAGNIANAEMISRMNCDAIVFAMANPVPEIMPHEAKRGGALIVGTGRSDFPNQINNLLAFPGIFRGALDCGARDITQEMVIAAAGAIAGVQKGELTPESILPRVLDRRVVKAVSKAVAEASPSL